MAKESDPSSSDKSLADQSGPEAATPEQEALAQTADLTDEHKEHYAEMNKEGEKHKAEGNFG